MGDERELADLRKNGWLVDHQPAPREIADLLEVAERDLADCRTRGLSADRRLNIAYNAALQAATAALAAAGFRAARDSHHHWVIQSLAHTVGADAARIAQFDAFRKKRNIAGYERVGASSDKEAREMAELAQSVRDDVVKWLEKTHPELLHPE